MWARWSQTAAPAMGLVPVDSQVYILPSSLHDPLFSFLSPFLPLFSHTSREKEKKRKEIEKEKEGEKRKQKK